MYKFVIEVPALVNNKGDAAIFQKNVFALTKHFPGSKIYVCYSKPIEHKDFFKNNISVYNRLFDHIEQRNCPMFFKLIELIFKTLQYLTWIKFKGIPIDKNAKSIFDLYQKSDIIIFTGGSYIGGSSLLNQKALIYIYLAKKLKKKVCLSGVTISPTNKFFIKILMKKILKKVDLITAREPITIEVLESLKIRTPKVLTADYAFLLENESIDLDNTLLDKLNIPKQNKVRIGISMKQFSKFEISDRKFENYKRKMVKGIEILIKKFDAIIFLFPMDTSILSDDRKIANSVKKMVEKTIRERIFVINEDCSIEELKSMIGTMDVFIATRFHAIIFAISMVVPTISLTYAQKHLGLMKMLGLNEWLLDFENFLPEQLVELTEKIIENREIICEKIKNQIPILEEKAWSNVILLENLLKK